MNGEAKLISVGDLFRESWGLYRERIGVLTRIMLLPVAFLLAGDFLVLLDTDSVLGGALVLLGIIISFIAALALIFALKESGQLSGSYRLALRRVWSYGWLTLLSGFVFLGGFFMLVIPGIIFSIWFMFAIYVFAIERDKGINALLKSREYVRGYWWPVFGRQIVIILTVVAFILGLKFIGAALTAGRGEALTIDLLALVFAPFTTAYLYVLYQNLKSLKPEVAGQPAVGPRGFFYFIAILGALGLIALFTLVAFLSYIFVSSGFNPNVLPNFLVN